MASCILLKYVLIITNARDVEKKVENTQSIFVSCLKNEANLYVSFSLVFFLSLKIWFCINIQQQCDNLMRVN